MSQFEVSFKSPKHIAMLKWRVLIFDVGGKPNMERRNAQSETSSMNGGLRRLIHSIWHCALYHNW